MLLEGDSHCANTTPNFLGNVKGSVEERPERIESLVEWHQAMSSSDIIDLKQNVEDIKRYDMPSNRIMQPNRNADLLLFAIFAINFVAQLVCAEKATLTFNLIPRQCCNDITSLT